MEEGKLLKYFIKNRKGLVVNDMCKEIEIKPQSLYQYYKSKELQPAVKQKFNDYFKEDIFSEENYQEYLNDKDNNDDNIVEEVDKLNPLVVINKLIDQNDTLVKSNAEAISNTSRLVGITENLTNRFMDLTGNDGPKSLTTFDSKMISLLESVSEIVVGKRFESSEEFLTLISRHFHVAPQNISLVGTQKD